MPPASEPAAATPPAPAPEPLTAESLIFAEGFTPQEEFVAEFVGMANELHLDAAAANRLVDMSQRMQAKYEEGIRSHWVEQVTEWYNDSVKAFGGEPALEAALGKIQALNNTYGSPQLAEALFLTGAEKHPAVLQFLAKVADKLVTEGGPVQGAPTSAPVSHAKRLFPNQN